MSNIKFNEYIEQFLNRYDEQTQTKEKYAQILNTISAQAQNLIIDDFKAIKQLIDNYTYKTRTNNIRKLCGNTKIGWVRVVKTYINYVANLTHEFFDTKAYLKSFASSATNRTNWTDNQAVIIRRYLDQIKTFHNKTDYQFKAIFELLARNGCRVGEFCNINWNIHENQNWQYDKENKLWHLEEATEKHGNTRQYYIPDEIAIWMPYINMPKGSIKRKFAQLQKLVRDNEPGLNRIKIFSHMMRYNFINKMHKNNIDIVNIARCTGHKSLNTIDTHYIKTNHDDWVRCIKVVNDDNNSMMQSVDTTKEQPNLFNFSNQNIS